MSFIICRIYSTPSESRVRPQNKTDAIRLVTDLRLFSNCPFVCFQMMADLMFRKNEYDSATFHFQQLLERKPGILSLLRNYLLHFSTVILQPTDKLMFVWMDHVSWKMASIFSQLTVQFSFKSDLRPYNINAMSNSKVSGIIKIVNYGLLFWSTTKFSNLTLKGQYGSK